MEEKQEVSFIEKIDVTGIVGKIISFLVRKYKNFKRESQIAKEIESTIIKVFNKYESDYTDLQDIGEDEKLEGFITDYCSNYNQEESINNFITTNSLIGRKAQVVNHFLSDLSIEVLDVYGKYMSDENKVLRSTIAKDITEIINKETYNVEELVETIVLHLFDAKFDLLKQIFDFIKKYKLTTEDSDLVSYIEDLIYNKVNTNIIVTTDNINILTNLVRLNLLFGNADFSNITNLNLLDEKIFKLISNYKDDNLKVYLTDKRDPTNEENFSLLSLICETIFYYSLRKNDFQYCELFYEKNNEYLQGKLTQLSYRLVSTNTLRNNYEVNPTDENKKLLSETLFGIYSFILNMSNLNNSLSLSYTVPFARLINFDTQELNKYVQKLPAAFSTHPSILYEVQLSRTDLKNEKPMNIIACCKHVNSTLLLKKYLMEKYQKPCIEIINFFEKYDILDIFRDADLFSIFATSLIDSRKYNAEKTLRKIKILAKEYASFIDYDIILGLYYFKYKKNKIRYIVEKLKHQFNSLKIGGIAFSNLIRLIAHTQSDDLLKELLCLNLTNNTKLEIAEMLYRVNLKHYFNDILEILNIFTNLDNHYTKVKADCLWLSKENKLALVEYKKVILSAPTNEVYSRVLALSLDLDEVIEDEIISTLQRIEDFGIQYNLGMYYKKHNLLDLAKKHIIQSLLLNDHELILKGGMFYLLLEDKNKTPFVCDVVKPNIAVYLENEDEKLVIFIHDLNVDFTEHSTSFNAIHYCFNDSKINDLRRKKVGESVCFCNKVYKITKLLPIDKIILDDCMKDLVENKTIQAITGNSVDDLKDFMKKQLRESNSIISKQIKTYNELGVNLKAPYSLIGKHMGKVGIDGYRSILVNPAIYKINSTAHLENESKYICCYDIICLCALLNLTELNTSSLYISSITKNRLLTEANEKIAELTNERTHGYMCLHEDKLFVFEENNEDIRKSLSYYSNIIDIVSKIPLITPKNVFKEEKKLKDALKDFYSDFEIESITCAKENNLIILSDDISIIKIGYYYKLTSVGILELMLRNYKSDDIIKACEKLKGFGFYNFIDNNVIDILNSNPNIGEDDCKKLVDVSSTKKDFEDVCIANYRYFLNSNKDSISSNKILQAMYNYIKNDLLNKYTLQTHMDLATGEVHFEWIPKDN